MQLGAENRTQLIILLVLLVVAAISVPYFLSGNGKPAATVASATPGTLPAKPAADAGRPGRKAPERKALLTPTLDPALRFDLLDQSEKQAYQGSTRNIFDSHPAPEIPPVDPDFLKKQQQQHDQQLANQGPPPPPPIPLKFYGFATQTGQAKRVFLSSTTGDDVFVGTEGQVINKRYRIVKINPTSVEIEDILNNNKQPIPLSPQT